jgi:hypothetical protein
MSIALEEAKEQNASLDAIIREMKIISAMCVDSHGGHLEFDLVSMEMLSKAYSDLESRIAQSMKQTEIRCALTSLPIFLLLFIQLEPHLPSKFTHYYKHAHVKEVDQLALSSSCFQMHWSIVNF